MTFVIETRQKGAWQAWISATSREQIDSTWAIFCRTTGCAARLIEENGRRKILSVKKKSARGGTAK